MALPLLWFFLLAALSPAADFLEFPRTIELATPVKAEKQLKPMALVCECKRFVLRERTCPFSQRIERAISASLSHVSFLCAQP